MAKAVKYLEGLTIHKVPYNIANTSDFKTNVMGKAADNELFIITDTPTFSLKIGNVTYDGTSNVSATAATQSASGLMSAEDKKKLDGIATGATKITVDTSISSTSTNPVQNKVIKTELDKKAGTAVATTSVNGLMSSADKTKLNGIATGANKTIVDTTLSDSSTNPVQNKVVKAALDNKADKTALDAKADKTALDGKLDKTGGTLTGNLTGKYLTGTWLQTTAATDLGRTPGKVAVLDDSGWVYYRTPAEIKSDIGANAVVTTSSNGLMSASDKSKLDGIAAGANKTTVDTALSNSSTNPVQNKVINSALSGKFSTSGGNISGDVFMLKNLDLNGVLVLNGALNAQETILAKKDVQCLYDDNLRIRLACDSSGAAKITTDGLNSYARLKIASPTDNNDAATKNYVDDALSGKAGTAVATTNANGLMSAADKTKLNGIATGATKITVDTALSSTSTNPVQNKVINSALGNKLDKSDKKTIIDMIYPVGSIYMSVNKTSPGTLFGGTWEQIAGKFLVGVGNGFVVGDSGGSKTHTHTTGDHTLTTDEMPYHAHNIWYPNSAGPTTSEIGYPLTGAKNTWCANASHTDGQGGDAAHNHGDTGSASNLPPYIAVWMWKRTA